MLASFVLYVFLQANTLSLSAPDSIVFREQFEKARQVSDTTGMAQAWFKQGAAYDDQGKMEKSNEALRKALTLAEHTNDHLLTGKIMNYLAINLGSTGKREEGIALSFKAFDQFILAGDTVRAANVKINIGMDYNNQGRYEEALKVELEALELRLQCGDSTNIATYYQRIGEVYKELGIRDKWKSSLETANRLASNPKYATFHTRIGILNDYGGLFEAEKQYDEAIRVYLDMYGRSKKEDYLNGMATALVNLSPVYRNTGQTDKALSCALEAIEIQKKRENEYGMLTVYNQLGEIYLVQEKTLPARENFLSALKLANKLEYKNDEMQSLNGLYRVAKTQGNWKEALVYHERWGQMEDSLQNIDLQEKITDIETRYQTEKKEQQIALLNQETELKNQEIRMKELVIVGGSLLFFAVVGLLIFWMRQRRIKHRNQQTELEQKLLRSQMNPHFIFNSLGAIQLFMMKNEGRKAAFYLGSFSSLMRSILKNSREEWISLQEEKQTLEDYLNLHQLRLGEKLSFAVEVSDELDAEVVQLPPMLVQPFVENAVLHGIEKMEGQGMIRIAFNKEGDRLVITVEDNGRGMEQSSGEKKDGHISYALQIFRERINNLKKAYKQDISYSFGTANPGNKDHAGTIVRVVMPLKIN